VGLALAEDPRDAQDEVSSHALAMPDIAMFLNSISGIRALPPIAKTMSKVTKKKCTSQWKAQINPVLKHVQVSMLSALINWSHNQSDITFEHCLCFRQTAFLGNILSTAFFGNILSIMHAALSSFQLGLCLQFVLELDFPA
jgi:hypothetical protein